MVYFIAAYLDAMKPESINACLGNETQASTTRPLRHAQRKSNVNFKCSNCQRRFPSILRLRRHINLVHRGAGKLSWCSKCNIGFNEVSAFLQHSRLHLREKTHGDIRSAEARGKFPDFHSEKFVFGGVDPQDDSNSRNTKNDESTTSSLGKNNNGDYVPETEDDSTNAHNSKEYNALTDNSNVLSDVVTHEAITVTVTQSDVGHSRSVGDRNDETSLKESPIVHHESQGDLTNIKKSQKSPIGFEHDCTSQSFLQGHPTMANIGTTKSSFFIGQDVTKVQRSSASNVAKGVSKNVKQQRQPACNEGRAPQSQFQSHNSGVNCPLNSVVDNLNISIPPNIQTINLMAETRSNNFQERLERSETLMYLRSVTAKLDAIIRHFNVPFSEQGNALMTTPYRTMPMQNARSTNDMELEGQSDSQSFSLAQHLPRKQSSSNLECTGADSPVLQRSVDEFHNRSLDDSAIERESALSFNSARFDDDSLFNADGVVLPEDLIRDLHSKSLNRGNFAKHLVFHLFSPEERKGKNCFGRRAGLQSGPKAPLDPVRLQYVREKVFQYYPCEPGLEETIWRRQCVIAVDTALRGENRPHKKLM